MSEQNSEFLVKFDWALVKVTQEIGMFSLRLNGIMLDLQLVAQEFELCASFTLEQLLDNEETLVFRLVKLCLLPW